MTRQTLPAHGIVVDSTNELDVWFVDPEIRTTLLSESNVNQLPNPPSSPKMTMIEPPPCAKEQIKADHLYSASAPDQGEKDILRFEHFTDSPTFTCVIPDDNVPSEPPDTEPKNFGSCAEEDSGQESTTGDTVTHTLHGHHDTKLGKGHTRSKTLSPFSSILVGGGSPRKSSRQPHDTRLLQPVRTENSPLSEFPQIRDMITYAARARSEAMFNMVRSEMRSIMDEAIGKISNAPPSTELCDADDVKIKHANADPSPDKEKIKVQRAKGRNKSLVEGEESNRYHFLTSAYFIRHLFLRKFASGPKDREKDPYTHTCRICRVERSMKTKGYTELKKHCECSEHLLRDQRVRLSFCGVPVYDKHLNHIHGAELLKVKQTVLRKYPDVSERLPIRLLVEQQSLPCCSPDEPDNDAPAVKQTMMLVKLLKQGGNLNLLENLWGFFCESTLHTATLSYIDWNFARVFVSSRFHI